MAKQKESSTESNAEALPWSPRVRGIVSFFLAFHVAAVFIAPWSMPQPASGLSEAVAQGIKPYLQAFALNNGYRFFAPNPGPSHVVHYRLQLRDGSLREGRFPNLEEQWPRQLYHRYFMVAETVDRATAGLFPQPMPPNEDPNFHRMSPAERNIALIEFQTAGRKQNEVKKELLQPIAQRLMIEHDANAVELWCLQHAIPSRDEFLNGGSPDRRAVLLAATFGHVSSPIMQIVTNYFRELSQTAVAGWNRFWFTPSDPATLGLIRLLGGSMIFYTHLVWSIDLLGFFGPRGRISEEFVRKFFGESPFAFSYLNWIDSPALLWTVHILGLVVLAMFAAGLFTRITSVLAFVITVSYMHRAAGALFGLDQINGLLALYLMIGPSGAAYSLDNIFARKGWLDFLPPWLRGTTGGEERQVTANLAIRLIQIHMCIVYLFAGTGKLLGGAWWDGTAMWLSFANYEYQSFDMTWLASHPYLLDFMTHLTIAWECSYIVFIWPRLTRPLVLALAIPLHLGIALCMGMITFGLVMLIANLAFVSPALVRMVVDPLAKKMRFAPS